MHTHKVETCTQTLHIKRPSSKFGNTRVLSTYSAASSLFKLLLKYRPEDKAAKKLRLLNKAKAEAEGKSVEEKRPFSVKHGLNHVTYLIEQVRGVVEQGGWRTEQIRGVVRGDVRNVIFLRSFWVFTSIQRAGQVP